MLLNVSSLSPPPPYTLVMLCHTLFEVCTVNNNNKLNNLLFLKLGIILLLITVASIAVDNYKKITNYYFIIKFWYKYMTAMSLYKTNS